MTIKTATKKRFYRKPRMYEIKVSGLHFDQVANRTRNFVIVIDDRKEGFEVGDLLIVQKYSDKKKVGDPVRREIQSFQKSGKGLMKGFVILGLE